jgi:hypothetical protein
MIEFLREIFTKIMLMSDRSRNHKKIEELREHAEVNVETLDSNSRELEKLILSFIFEIIILLIHFPEFHDTLLKEEFFTLTIYIAEELKNFHTVFYIEERHTKEELNYMNFYNFSENELKNLIKLICTFLNQATYYEVLQGDLIKARSLDLMLEVLLSQLKNCQLIIFNTLTNLAEGSNFDFLRSFIEVTLNKSQILNQKCISDKTIKENSVNYEAVLSLIEHFYFSKNSLGFFEIDTQEAQLELKEIKYYLGFLVSNLIVEKHQLKLSKKIVELLLKEAPNNCNLEPRVVVIIFKILSYNEGIRNVCKSLLLY